jgi:tRNA(Ile)-lysidine synthase
VNKSAPAADSGGAISEREALGLFSLFPRSGRVLLAVSGGADSTALLVLAVRWRAAHAPALEVKVATVDHALRQDSRAEAEQVALLCQRFDLPHQTLTWDGAKPETGIEESAREARRGLLASHARSLSAGHIVTAHTLDDQAETVLMRLAAGSGPAGLVGIRPEEKRDGLVWLRPFLAVPKQRLVLTLQRNGIAWSEDPMNRDPRFQRPRLRQAAEVLAREGLTAERLARLAQRMARYEAVVAGCTEAAIAGLRPEQPGRWDGEALLALPEEIALRILGREIAAVAQHDATAAEHPVRLQRLEALWRDLRQALLERGALRRNLAGALISSSPERAVTISPEPARRHSQKPTTKVR